MAMLVVDIPSGYIMLQPGAIFDASNLFSRYHSPLFDIAMIKISQPKE